MNETQRGARSSQNGQPLSKEQLQQQMQSALNNGQMRPRKKNSQMTGHKRVSDLSSNPRSAPVRSRRPASTASMQSGAPRSSAEEKAEKMRQIKASIASANQGIYTDESSSVTAAEAQRYVNRRSNNPAAVPAYNRGSGRTSSQPQNRRSNSYNNGYADAPVSNPPKPGLIIVIILFVVLMIAYLIGYFSYRNALLPNTFVNNVDVSGMTLEEAEEAIIENASTLGITFIKKSGEEIHFSGEEFGSVITLQENALQEAANESHVLWFTKLLHKTNYEAGVINSYSESSLSNLVLSYSWGTTPPTDAYLQKGSDGVYSIVPEDDGDMIDSSILMNYTLEQMRSGNNVIDMTNADCYLKAEVKSEDLQEALEASNSLAGLTITYDFEDRQEVLDTETIADWITADEEGNLTVSENKAMAWVQENLVKYDTFVTGYTRTFHSTLQGTLEIPLGKYGIYGWQTDVNATVEKLQEYILAGESVTVEPEYSRRAYCRGTDDIGDTYVEVDITNQKVWVYQDGQIVLETDCVTGLATDPERATPPGVYKIWSMERDRILGTYEVQGYEEPVEYWIYFTEIGIGFHDLERSAYGGDIYQYNGSHGCVNLPLEAAAKMFSLVENGYPVIVIE